MKINRKCGGPSILLVQSSPIKPVSIQIDANLMLNLRLYASKSRSEAPFSFLCCVLQLNALKFQGRFKAISEELTSVDILSHLNGHMGTVNLSWPNGYRNLTSRLGDEWL